MNLLGVKVFACIGIVLFVLLLARYWFGESGWFEVRALAAEVAAQEQRTAELQENNRLLIAEVMALKRGLAAVEASARTDLGMVAEGETFYLVVEGEDRDAR